MPTTFSPMAHPAPSTKPAHIHRVIARGSTPANITRFTKTIGRPRHRRNGPPFAAGAVLGLGVLLSGADPRNFVLSAAALTAVGVLVLLAAVRQFMVAHRVVITVIVLLILGAKVLSDGLIGLGREGG